MPRCLRDNTIKSHAIWAICFATLNLEHFYFFLVWHYCIVFPVSDCESDCFIDPICISHFQYSYAKHHHKWTVGFRTNENVMKYDFHSRWVSPLQQFHESMQKNPRCFGLRVALWFKDTATWSGHNKAQLKWLHCQQNIITGETFIMCSRVWTVVDNVFSTEFNTQSIKLQTVLF